MIPQYLIQHINKRLIWFVASQKEKVKIKNQLNHNWLNYSINIDDSSIFNTTDKQEIDLVFCFSKREGKNQKS